jgi:hypothetical protein
MSSSPSKLSRNAFLLALGCCALVGGSRPVLDSSDELASPEPHVPVVVQVLPPDVTAVGSSGKSAPSESAPFRIEND